MDHGGPLVNRVKHTALGVLSYVPFGKKQIVIYNRVDKYHTWITDVMNNTRINEHNHNVAINNERALIRRH